MSGVIHATAAVFSSFFAYPPLALKKPLCMEKFCSWAEETSIWLRNNTITQEQIWPLQIWPSTLILLNFNFVFWKRDSLSEEKILQKFLLAQGLKLIGFRYLLGGEHVHHQMKTWAGMGSLLGLFQNNLPSLPTKEITKISALFLYS